MLSALSNKEVHDATIAKTTFVAIIVENTIVAASLRRKLKSLVPQLAVFELGLLHSVPSSPQMLYCASSSVIVAARLAVAENHATNEYIAT